MALSSLVVFFIIGTFRAGKVSFLWAKKKKLKCAHRFVPHSWKQESVGGNREGGFGSGSGSEGGLRFQSCQASKPNSHIPTTYKHAKLVLKWKAAEKGERSRISITPLSPAEKSRSGVLLYSVTCIFNVLFLINSLPKINPQPALLQSSNMGPLKFACILDAPVQQTNTLPETGLEMGKSVTTMVWPMPEISTGGIWGNFSKRGDTMGADFSPQKRVILWIKHNLCKNDVPCMYIFYCSQGRLTQSSYLRHMSQNLCIYFLNYRLEV